MPLVRFISDPLDLSTFVERETDDLVACIQAEFPAWPKTARIYRGAIAQQNDITPHNPDTVRALEDDNSPLYYVVVYPGDPVTAIIAVVATIALAALMFIFMPKIPSLSNDIGSANNSLSGRVNKPRPNGRIPDIFGTVIAVPELLTVPITTYEDNVEVEVCFMCLGRGEYSVDKVKDGGTPLGLIAGAGAAFYGPDTSPNNADPALVVGAPVEVPFRDVLRLNEVNGQALDPPDQNSVSGSGNIRFVAPNYIENSGGIDFTELFGVGDDLNVANANFGGSAAVFDATTQNARFYPDGRVEFETFNPTTLYAAGQFLQITNAGFAGVDGVGAVVYVDVSGTYEIDTVSSTELQLVI